MPTVLGGATVDGNALVANADYILNSTTPSAPQPPAVVTGGAIWTPGWSDEFDAGLSKWNVLDDSTFGSGNNEEERYYARNVSVVNGILQLLAKKEASSGHAYSSGMVTTRGGYGAGQTQKSKIGGNGKTTYVESRIKMPIGGGYWPAFWLVGADGAPGWPAYGEIDIVEGYGEPFPKGTIECTYHWVNGGNKQQGGQTIPMSSGMGEWHTYGVLWTPTQLKFIIDGKVVQTFTASDAGAKAGLNYEHTIILNLAVGGDGPRKYHNWDGTWEAGAEMPGSMLVDYVRTWNP